MITQEQRKELFCEYQSGAEQGDVQAIKNLANCYLCGLGVEQNVNKAIEWFTLAIDKGDDMAALILANIYYSGSAIKRDCKKAIELYTKAAEQGNDIAKILLAKMYYYGEGCKKDYEKVIELCVQAAKNNADANFILGVLHSAGLCNLKQDFKVGLQYLDVAKCLYQREGASNCRKRLRDVEGIIWLCNQVVQGVQEAEIVFDYVLDTLSAKLFTVTINN
jgi:TPR repeat protein